MAVLIKMGRHQRVSKAWHLVQPRQHVRRRHPIASLRTSTVWLISFARPRSAHSCGGAPRIEIFHLRYDWYSRAKSGQQKLPPLTLPPAIAEDRLKARDWQPTLCLILASTPLNFAESHSRWAMGSQVRILPGSPSLNNNNRRALPLLSRTKTFYTSEVPTDY